MPLWFWFRIFYCQFKNTTQLKAIIHGFKVFPFLFLLTKFDSWTNPDVWIAGLLRSFILIVLVNRAASDASVATQTINWNLYFHKTHKITFLKIYYNVWNNWCFFLFRCLTESSLICRSASFNTLTLMCYMSRYTKRTNPSLVVYDDDYDYLENHCLSGNESIIYYITNKYAYMTQFDFLKFMSHILYV